MRDRIRPTLGTCLLTLLLCHSAPETHARPQGLEGHQVVGVVIENRKQLETLVALDRASRDLEIWSEGVGLGIIEVHVSPEQKRALDASGFSYEVYIEDLQRRIDEVFAGSETRGFFDAYRSYDEHVTFMSDLVAAYPTLAEMVNLGASVEGRPLWAIRITGSGDDKPGLMYHGGQHGNEVMGTCVVSYLAEFLLTSYDTDPQVQKLVDDVEWFLLPIMNPDGYERGRRYNYNGVDLNRNWGGPGAYPNPFSEPETAALRDFFLAHPTVRAHVDFHTHGRMILWPWGYTSTLCDDNDTYIYVGDEMAYRIYLVRGSEYDERGPVSTTIYPVYGGSVDYSYGVLDLWAIAYELGYSHSMPTSEIIPTCEEITPAMTFFAGWISDCNGNGILDDIEISGGASTDDNDNGIPDECEAPGIEAPTLQEPHFATNRSLSLVPGNSGTQTALRVTFEQLPPPYLAWNGATMWLGPPEEHCENAGEDTPPPEGCSPAPGLESETFVGSTLQCDPYYDDFGALGTVHAFHEGVIPGATYYVQAIRLGDDSSVEANYSHALALSTSGWADVVSNCITRPCGPPDGTVGIPTDVTAVLDKFKNLEGAPTKARCDLEPAVLDFEINITDVMHCVDAFRGWGYPFEPSVPLPCP